MEVLNFIESRNNLGGIQEEIDSLGIAPAMCCIVLGGLSSYSISSIEAEVINESGDSEIHTFGNSENLIDLIGRENVKQVKYMGSYNDEPMGITIDFNFSKIYLTANREVA